MAGAIVGLAVPGVEIDDIATTSKTLPEFPSCGPTCWPAGCPPHSATTTSPMCASARARAPGHARKTRPEHADARSAMVVTVDRGRWGCVLDGDPGAPVTAMRARELGRTRSWSATTSTWSATCPAG